MTEPKRRDTRVTLAAADGDQGLPQMTATGDVRVRDDDLNAYFGTTPVFSDEEISAAANGTRTLLAAPGAGFALWIYGIVAIASAIGTVQFIDSTPANLTGSIVVAANQQITYPNQANYNAPWFKCAENTAFQVILSLNTALAGSFVYRTVVVP